MVKMTGGEALVKSLVNEGVEVVFGIPGIHMSGVVVAMREEAGIRMITTRHELGAAHMADGYARVSGKPGVALVVPGAGVYNAAAGLATAYARSSPVLLIAGQIPRGQIGQDLGAIHEVANQAEVLRPVTKWRRQAEQLREVARVIARSRLPLIFAGGGVARSGAEQALMEMAEATNIPVVTSSGGKGAIPDSHPLCYGSCLSPAGERHEMNQLFEVMQSADVMIGVGSRFSLGNPAGESCTLVNINIDDGEPTRVATLEALLPFLVEAGAGERPSPVEAVVAARRLIAYYDIRLQEPQYPILETIKNSIPEETFTVWDVTQFGYYSRTHYQVNQPKTYIDSGYSFNLGYSFPTALGAKVAGPDRPVVCVTGDGGFMFNATELSTAVKYGINAITIVFRDDAYGNVGRDLDEFFAGTYETDLHNPDLVRFAESFGAVGMRTDDPMDLATLLPEALERQAPVVIDVPVADMPLPRAKQHAHLAAVPWMHPHDGLILS